MPLTPQRIGYLACQDTISTNPGRRWDAFEHDREYLPVKAELEARGHSVEEVDWMQVDPQADDWDVLLIRTAWDYIDNEARFRAFVDEAEQHTRLLNCASLIRWNLSKRYLKDLADRGLSVIPSLFPEHAMPLDEVFEHFDCETVVVKKIVGAGGFHQHRYTRGDVAPMATLSPDMFAQPFIPGILDEGELSFIFFNGAFSHGVQKRPQAGEYRIQSLYGGIETQYHPTAAEILRARAYLDAAPETALAARVDVVRGEWGDAETGLMLMECEVIEPYLYPVFEPHFARRFSDALEAMLRS